MHTQANNSRPSQIGRRFAQDPPRSSSRRTTIRPVARAALETFSKRRRKRPLSPPPNDRAAKVIMEGSRLIRNTGTKNASYESKAYPNAFEELKSANPFCISDAWAQKINTAFQKRCTA